MAHAARLARIIGAVFRSQRRRHVVGVDDGHFGGFAQSVGPQHFDVSVGDRQEQRRTPRGRRDRRDALVAARGYDGMRGQERPEMLRDADRADARTAAAVGHGERLVQVEVADVGPDVAGIRQSHLRVHVGAVHVDLSARIVNGVHDLADAAFEDAVRRGISHHQAAQLRGVLLGLGLEIGHVDVAVGVACHRHDLHARHRGRRRVGAVSRGRDQHHVAVALTAALVVGADHHQSRVLACGARVGLQRAGREAGDRRQVLFQLRDELQVALGLVRRGEGVHVLEARQRQRLHERRGVELHGAGP